MATTIGDGADDERRYPLPESVDRTLGQVVPRGEDGQTMLDASAAEALRKHLAAPQTDSNLDRLPLGLDMDALIDGNKAVAALLRALDERLRNPILPNEHLLLLPSVR